MSKLIIHLGTGTILDADDGVVVLNTDLIANDDDFDIDDESSIIQMAELYGKPVNTELPADTNYGNIISFSPSSLREEARELLGLGKYAHDEEINDALSFMAFLATDEELQITANYILNDDSLWNEYTPSIVSGAMWAETQYKNLERNF